MKISIIGTGAIGGYYGTLLANAGHQVHFLLHSDYEYVQQNGLQLTSSVHEDIVLPKVNAYNNVHDMPEADVVLVGLKTTQNESLLPKLLAPLAKHKSLVVLIQNGLGMEEDLAAHFPEMQIAGGVALIGSHKTNPGHIEHQDYGNLDLGSYNVKNNELLKQLVVALNTAGVASTLDDLKTLRWKKLVWNMSFNGLTVALNTTTDQIIENEESLTRCKQIMREVILAAKANGVLIPESFVEEAVSFTMQMKPYKPSMKLDFDYNRPLELRYLYQRPIKVAAEAGFEMKITNDLYEELCEITSYEMQYS